MGEVFTVNKDEPDFMKKLEAEARKVFEHITLKRIMKLNAEFLGCTKTFDDREYAAKSYYEALVYCGCAGVEEACNYLERENPYFETFECNWPN